MRFFEIVWVLSKYTVFHKLSKNRDQILGERLRLAFQELGLAFIKIGQILSMRYDLLSKDDCYALQRLLDKVDPLSYETIDQILWEEYGKSPEKVFQKFEKTPLGSASVSQVHKAELFDSSLVAVKIKRPNVDRKFKEDIMIMKALARMVEFFSKTMRNVQVVELVNYFQGWVEQDLNFVQEVKNLKLVNEQYGFGRKPLGPDLGRGYWPLPHEEYCTENIVVMDYLEGIPLSNIEEIKKHPDYDAEKSIRTYATAAMMNWFSEDNDYYVYQGDPHLSNVFAMPGGDAGSIDAGLIDIQGKRETRVSKLLVLAVYMKDLEEVTRLATELAGVDYEEYADILRPDIREYLKKTDSEGFGFWFLDMVRIMVKNGVKFPLFMTTFGRTNVVLEGLVKTYMPEETTVGLFGDLIRREIIKQTFRELREVDPLPVVYNVSKKIKEAPKILNNFIDDPMSLVREVRQVIRESI